MSSEARLDIIERRLTSVIDRYLPYLGLAIGTIVTPFMVDGSAEYWLVTGGLVAVAATWSYVFTTWLAVRASDPRTGAVYVAGPLVLLVMFVARAAPPAPRSPRPLSAPGPHLPCASSPSTRRHTLVVRTPSPS